MSTPIFPDLGGISWPVIKKPMNSTKIQTSLSGKEKRASLWSYPRYEIKLTFDSLFDSGMPSGLPSGEVQQLMGFFLARRGAFEEFLFYDMADGHVQNQIIGYGDGSNRVFQLTRTYGSYTEPVRDVKGFITFIGAGVPTSYSIDSKGLVTFTSPPSAGAVITCSYDFYYRCRFKEDELEFENFMYKLWSAKTVELITVK